MRFTDNAELTAPNMDNADILAGTDVSTSTDKKFTLSGLADWLLNRFTGLSLAGSNQSVKSALDGLNSTTRVDFTPAVGSSYTSYGGCYYETMGKLVHVHLGVSGLTSGASNALYTLPAALRPSNTIFDVASAGGAGKFSGVEIRPSGAVVAVPNGTYCGADVIYFV